MWGLAKCCHFLVLKSAFFAFNHLVIIYDDDDDDYLPQMSLC